MYDFYHICVRLVYHPSSCSRSAAEWSALGSWKCSCFGNRGDWSFWDVMVSTHPRSSVLESWLSIFFVQNAKWSNFSTIFRCCLLFLGGVVMFWYVLPQQPIHLLPRGGSPYWSWSAGAVREVFETSVLHEFVPTNSRKKRPPWQRFKMGTQENWYN